jgi:hypothetical protein
MLDIGKDMEDFKDENYMKEKNKWLF